jgi:hypothetical protein
MRVCIMTETTKHCETESPSAAADDDVHAYT